MTSAATTVGRKSVASNLAGIVSICHRSRRCTRASDGGSPLLSRDSISRRGATGSALLSPLLPYHFAPPESCRGGGAEAQPGPYGWQFSWRTGRKRDTRGRPIGWLLLSCHFRLSGRRVTGISQFIFRLLNYIPINNTRATPDELIYHSTGTAGGSTFSSGKPSNRRICHPTRALRLTAGGIGSPLRILVGSRPPNLFDGCRESLYDF